MKIVLYFILMLIITSSATAEIYKWTDENGRVHFTDSKPSDVAAESVKIEINTYTHVSYDTSEIDVGKQVIMYSTSWCGYCTKARNYFNQHNIKFVEYDIEHNLNAKRKYDELGVKGVPVILIGKRKMTGFSEVGFNEFYNQ